MGRFLPIFLSLAVPPSLCVRMITSLSGAQGCRFFVFVQLRPADALLSPEPGGDQGTLFAHNEVQGYTGLCVIFYFVFLCYICSPVPGIQYILLCFLCYICSPVPGIHFFPSRGCRWCHLPCIPGAFRFFISPPQHASDP